MFIIVYKLERKDSAQEISTLFKKKMEMDLGWWRCGGLAPRLTKS